MSTTISGSLPQPAKRRWEATAAEPANPWQIYSACSAVNDVLVGMANAFRLRTVP